ncbi:MAG: hypothetical protein HKP10_07035 [Kiritimatiellales bacterium]|nr:hypothetical protein [Kiritimatiellales bacterium]
MPSSNQKKIVRLLGVGFDAEDGHVRITKGENYDVLMGSDESHEYIQTLIHKIEDELSSRGVTLDNLTPEEFAELVASIK